MLQCNNAFSVQAKETLHLFYYKAIFTLDKWLEKFEHWQCRIDRVPSEAIR